MEIELMRYYYINGLWDRDRLDKLLQTGHITQSQYQEITADIHVTKPAQAN